MATLNGTELQKARRILENEGGPVTHLKTHANAALQALETKWESTWKAVFAQEMEDAAPGVFTADDMRLIGKIFFLVKFNRGG